MHLDGWNTNTIFPILDDSYNPNIVKDTYVKFQGWGDISYGIKNGNPINFGEMSTDDFLKARHFIDEDEFVREVISSDGRGNGLAGYDGEENEIVYDGEWFYIYRIG